MPTPAPKTFELGALSEDEVYLLANAFHIGVQMCLAICAMMHGAMEQSLEHSVNANELAVILHAKAHPDESEKAPAMIALLTRVNKLINEHNDHVIARDMLGGNDNIVDEIDS